MTETKYRSSNRAASKIQAVALINRAVKAGFKREVSVYRGTLGQVFSVTVELSLSARWGGLYDWTHVWISFRKFGKRRSVSILSRAQYEDKSENGFWGANYKVNKLIEAVQTRPGAQLHV